MEVLKMINPYNVVLHCESFRQTGSREQAHLAHVSLIHDLHVNFSQKLQKMGRWL